MSKGKLVGGCGELWWVSAFESNRLSDISHQTSKPTVLSCKTHNQKLWKAQTINWLINPLVTARPGVIVSAESASSSDLTPVCVLTSRNHHDYHQLPWWLYSPQFSVHPGLCPISLVWLMLIHQVILLLSSQGVMGKSESESTGIKCKISLFYFPKNCNRECKMMASVICEGSARLWPLRNAELARNKQVDMVTRLSCIVNKKWTRNVVFSLFYLNVI